MTRITNLTVDYLRTPAGAELVPYLAVLTTPTLTVVYSLDLGADIAPYTILQVYAQVEATNAVTYNIDTVTRLVLATSPTATAGTTIWPAEIAGENITPNPGMHHGYRTPHGAYQAPADQPAGYRYVNLVMAAASTSGHAGQAEYIEHGYGGLAAVLTTGTPV